MYVLPKKHQSYNEIDFKNKPLNYFSFGNRVTRRFLRHKGLNGQVKRVNQTLARWLRKDLFETEGKI